MLPCMAKETADMIKSRILRWGDYHRLSGRSNPITRVFINKKKGGRRVRVREGDVTREV